MNDLCSYAERPNAIPRRHCPLAVWVIALSVSILSLAILPTVSAQSINDQPSARITAAPVAKLDINRASIPQLMRVHGITQSYAQRIVAGRPYSNKGQLKSNGILPPQVYESAKDRLIAHRMK